MKYKRLFIVLFSVLFFLTAVTFYINRVIFPTVIKKIAVERMEGLLRRKVEMGSLHFNWVRGFIMDKVKIYEKDPRDGVFAQAEQVSFGVIIFPGLKHYRITIPFINVRSPSVHLVRTGGNTWNFSDMYAATSPAPASTTAVPVARQPPAFELAWGGLTISDGKCLVEDTLAPRPWNELFDDIDLKLSLSYQGISYDLTADIPGKNGFIGATVHYQPLTQDTQAKIRLKNIDTASYLSLIDTQDIHLNSGIIRDIDLNIDHTRQKTSAQGDVAMQDLDIQSGTQSFKGDIELKGMDAQYVNGNISARGQMNLAHVETSIPGLSAGGNVQTKIADLEMTQDTASFSGSLHGEDIVLDLKDRRVKAANVSLQDIKIAKNAAGMISSGSMTAQGLWVKWPDQQFQGDVAFKDAAANVKDNNDFTLESQIEADHLISVITDKKGKVTHISADTLRTDKLSANGTAGLVKIAATLNSSGGKIVLDNSRTIEADPRMELALQMPLNGRGTPVYKGSMTLSGARLEGFGPLPVINNVDLDVDFQNDAATINALSADILNTNVRVSGTIADFQKPVLTLAMETDELDLSQIMDLAPALVDQYGLSIDGTASVKVQYEGPADNPKRARVQARATFKDVNIASSKLQQKLTHISGAIEATPDTLTWHGFNCVYQDKPFSLEGSMSHFKAPRILTTVSGENLQFKADILKEQDHITINALTGKYLNADFNSSGTIDLPPGSAPVFDINGSVSLLLEDLIKVLPEAQKKGLAPLNPSGMISMTSTLKGSGLNWKDYLVDAQLTSPGVHVMGYSLTGVRVKFSQSHGKINDMTLDGTLYDGTVHAVGSMDLLTKGLPYDLALNIQNTDLHQLKMDSPLKMEEINGKVFLTSVAHGTVENFKDTLQASGSVAIKDGFLGEFDIFKGLLSVLNDALRLGQIDITDVQGNFTVADQKVNTADLSLKGPTIALLAKGWVNFDALCDLDVTVDLTSGVVPAIAHDVLNTLDIRIYDKITDPKFKKKISVPQVINSLIKNFLQ